MQPPTPDGAFAGVGLVVIPPEPWRWTPLARPTPPQGSLNEPSKLPGSPNEESLKTNPKVTGRAHEGSVDRSGPSFPPPLAWQPVKTRTPASADTTAPGRNHRRSVECTMIPPSKPGSALAAPLTCWAARRL